MTDARVDAFLADVFALEGENTDAIHDGVHIALKDCENIFRVLIWYWYTFSRDTRRMTRPIAKQARSE